MPGFDDVLERLAPQPDRRPARRLQVAVLCGALATLFVVFMIARSQFDGPNGQPRPNIVEDDRPHQPADSTESDNRVQGDGGVEINFEHLHTVVDDYFRNSEVEAIEVPEWSTRTDSLHALNLEIPLTED
ncbi:MAG: hypothetical protein IH899_19230 [Planctomycetes bacterium]|nr:hypothetical protein [Planctomycetota bacterium]